MSTENPAESTPLSHTKRSKKILWAAASALLVILITGGLLSYRFLHTTNPIPKDIQQATSLTLYYPGQLPKDWQLDTTSFSIDNDVVFYTIKGPKANIIISIQSRPATFDFVTFYQQGLSGTSQFSTPLGSGAVGEATGKTIGSLVAGKSWILASPTSSDITGDELTFLLSNLKKS